MMLFKKNGKFGIQRYKNNAGIAEPTPYPNLGI